MSFAIFSENITHVIKAHNNIFLVAISKDRAHQSSYIFLFFVQREGLKVDFID